MGNRQGRQEQQQEQQQRQNQQYAEEQMPVYENQKVMKEKEVTDFVPPPWVEEKARYDLSGMETCESGYEYKTDHTILVLSACGKCVGRAIFESGQGIIESPFEGTWEKRETEEWEDEGNVYVTYDLPYMSFAYHYEGNLSEMHMKYQGRFSKQMEEEKEGGWTYEEIPTNEKGRFVYDVKPMGRATKGARRR